MQRLRGATLEEHLRRRGPLAPARVVAIALQLCDALARLHARGVLHRDLKPANIFLLRDTKRPDAPRDRIKLLDLGIAKLTAAFYTADANTTPPEDRLRTRAGVVLGTPGYIAPELLHGERDPHPRQDIFALGVTLFKIATGAAPFAHPHAAAVGDPPRSAPNLPSALEQLLHTALAADPTARYQSIAELKDDLELVHAELTAIAGTRETSPRPPSNPTTPPRPRSSADASHGGSTKPAWWIHHLAPPPLDSTGDPELRPADRPAPSPDVAASPTSTKPSTGGVRWLPWLVAGALALGWFASAQRSPTPDGLIAHAQDLSSTIIGAARIALAPDSPAKHDVETGIDTPESLTEGGTNSAATGPATSGTGTGGRVDGDRGATTIPSAPASAATSRSADSKLAADGEAAVDEAAALATWTSRPAEPTPAAPSRLTRADIRRALADRRAELDLCLPGDGPIDLRLVIAADGRLLRATTLPAGSTIARQCITEALVDLRLPAAGAPSTHTIRLREP